MRDPSPSDWPTIARLADIAVSGLTDASSQSEWVAARMSFVGERCHHVCESDGEVFGYCAIESSGRDRDRSFRVFLVLDWRARTDVAAFLYRQVVEDLHAVRATVAWMREYASDTRLIDFVRDCGFVVDEPYAHDGMRLVTLRKALARPTRRNT